MKNIKEQLRTVYSVDGRRIDYRFSPAGVEGAEAVAITKTEFEGEEVRSVLGTYLSKIADARSFFAGEPIAESDQGLLMLAAANLLPLEVACDNPEVLFVDDELLARR